MKHIITDEEAKRYNNKVFLSGKADLIEAHKAALLDFLNNRPESTLGKLRPIAEMPETVPDGCVRMFVYRHASGCFGGPFFIHSTGERFNFFADIQLPTPDPEAEERQRFEEAMKRAFPHFTFKFHENGSGEYANPHCETSWTAWKLAKAK